MQSICIRRCTLSLAIAFGLSVSATAAVARDYQDHYEFEATLHAPYRALADHSRTFDMRFRFPGADDDSVVAWQVDIVNDEGDAVRTWRGESLLVDGQGSQLIPWSERDPQNGPLAYGFYRVNMRAYALNPLTEKTLAYGTLDERVIHALSLSPDEVEDQTFDIQVGPVASPKMPAFAGLHTNHSEQVGIESVAATDSLPYTVYLGNLHSQTNLSDGGGVVSTCDSEQPPQSANGGTPTVAYTYAMGRGLDFLMTSEHNHMFDGSTGTNASASPTTAKNLYHSGQTMRDNFNSAHPNFLALAGLEWGVISNGGHMNIFNTPSLLEWEYNSSNQLIGDVFTAKGDYAALFTLMNQNGWIGQFNHPASGQFLVNGTSLAYTADGDAAMVACEVMNSSAFSTNTTESETSQSSYIGQCNKALEAGYHVAFTTDQDNHCANWGASFTNRNGVLIPTGQALNLTNFYAALKARHVYATFDKTSQAIMTTNGGHIMGDRFNNAGVLTLTVNYAPGAGRSASQIQIYQGVPGSNGTVAVLSSTAVTTTTPATGDHFYYAKVTQDNGTLIYTAPVWVTQGTGGGDTTPPSVSASESGASGTITLAATASDNVGVSKVEFYVDGALKATDTSSPYSTTLDSTTIGNGSHALVAKAYDAANNIGTSSSVAFTITNATSDTTPPTVSSSETGSSGTITLAATASDNVGVTRVEFYVDGALKSTDTTSPYSVTLDSTTLSNASHSLVAKAYDSANNVGTSSTVSFTVNNTTSTPTERLTNGGFESGTTGWTATSGVIGTDAGEAAHAGSYKAWLDGYGTATTDTVVQSIAIPSTVTSATLSFWLHIDTDETTTTKVYDTLTVQILSSTGTVLATLATYSNLGANTGYAQQSFDVSAYKGQTVKVSFKGVEDAQDQTSFVIDDVSLKTQ